MFMILHICFDNAFICHAELDSASLVTLKRVQGDKNRLFFILLLCGSKTLAGLICFLHFKVFKFKYSARGLSKRGK
jgi:hypothetical protein